MDKNNIRGVVVTKYNYIDNA